MATTTSSSSSKSSNAVVDSYIGSFISLISKSEVRYEGLLYHLTVSDSTIGLKNVRSYGTEGRKKDGPQIPASDTVYEYILFHGSDIKDLQVKSSPPAHVGEPIHNDPAIIQSHYVGLPSSSSPSVSMGAKTLMESAQGQITPALASRSYCGAFPSSQSLNHVGLPNVSQSTQNAGPSFSMPVYWQGYNGASSNMSDASPHVLCQPPSMVSSPLPVQNQMQAPGLHDSPIMGLTNASGCVTPVPSVASNALHPDFSASLTPVQYSTSPNTASSLPMKTSLLSHAAYVTDNGLIMSSIPLSSQDKSINEVQSVGKAVSDPLTVHSTQSMPYPVSSYLGSTPTPLLTPPLSLLSPNRSAQSRQNVLSSMQRLYPDQKEMGTLTPLSSASLALMPTPSQAPLLPLPSSAQQNKYLTAQFTEEFDFEAMNEKFKKDEVWGYLGKAKQRDKLEGSEDSATDQTLDDKEASGPVAKIDPKPAYKKDEFFDTISCNSLTRGRNGQSHFSERMKLDTETFGSFHQRPNLGYGGYGIAGRGNNYHGSPNWGRGYGYGGRGRGNVPF